ncbi:MAG: DUF222 domain-containing protein, partial [Acidimicrobiia bacterium]
EIQAEENLIFELTEAGLRAEPEPGMLALPPDLDSWVPDLRLAAVLSMVDVHALSGPDRVRYLKAQDRLNSTGQAQFLGAVTSIADAYDVLTEDIEDPDAGASLELRAALRWTRRAADTELSFALDLRNRLPRVFDALSAGLVDRARARILVRHTDHLPIAQARMAVDTLLDEAATLTTGQLVEAVRRVCLDIDPDSARERYQSSRKDRRVESWPDPDGTVTLAGIGLDPVDVASATDLIDRLARERRSEDPSRSIDQHRADVFSDLLNGTTTGRSGTVHLTVDLATLARLNDDAADLSGYGPVGADIARQVTAQLGDGIWNWTLTDPDSGMPLADGTTRRRPTASQVRRVRARNRTCVAPGCRMPVIDCDIDHTRTWADTGITDCKDLAPLCRHDHCIRHQNGWTYEPLPDGDYLWKSPLGTVYTTSGRDP